MNLVICGNEESASCSSQRPTTKSGSSTSATLSCRKDYTCHNATVMLTLLNEILYIITYVNICA